MRWKDRWEMVAAMAAAGGTVWTLASCTVPNPNACTDCESTDGDLTDDGAATDDATDDEAGNDDGDPLAPELGPVRVDGSDSPATVEASAVLRLSVDVSAQADVDAVEFLDGTTSLGMAAPASGDAWALDWRVIGDRFDGAHELTARAVDVDDRETTSQPTTLQIDLPDHGTFEWVIDDEVEKVLYADLAIDDEKGFLVAAGSENGDAHIDALALDDGSAVTWTNASFNGKYPSGDTSVSSVTRDPGAPRFVVTGTADDDVGRSNAYVAWFDTDGVRRSTWEGNYAPNLEDRAVAAQFGASGGTYVVVDTADGDGRIVRFDNSEAFDQQELLDLAPTDMAPGAGDLFALGDRTTTDPRLERVGLDLATKSSTGVLTGTRALAVDEVNQRIVVVGRKLGNIARVTAYDFDYAQLWSTELFPLASSSDAVDVAIDPLGTVVVVAGNDTDVSRALCTFDGANGEQRWCERFTAGFGYVWAAVETDDLGNIYAVGQYYTPSGGSRLVARVHP